MVIFTGLYFFPTENYLNNYVSMPCYMGDKITQV